MSYKSTMMPTYAAYGGVPQEQAYGGVPASNAPKGAVPTEAAYGGIPLYQAGQNKQINSITANIPDISLGAERKRNAFTTESAWGYPNNTQNPFYNIMGRPYDIWKNYYKLGTLSGLYESNNGQKLWNNCNADRTGGCSYGTYQIETKKGTMKDYLKYLQGHQNYQDFYNKLQQAGGYDTALRGDSSFKKVWADLSENEDFLQSQQDFIVDKKLNPALYKIRDIKGLDFERRSPVLKDVLYSTATQHGQGGAAEVMHRSFGNNIDISSLSDEEIIKQIYDERSDVNYHFEGSSQDTRNRLKKRFQREKTKALELLKQYR